MTSFVLSPEMKAMIVRAKTTNAPVQCDPRRFYPIGHECAPPRVKPPGTPTGKVQPPWITGVYRGPIDAGGVPIPDKAIIVKQEGPPTRTVSTIQTGNGDTVEATTDANGAVTRVEVKENKWLIPAALAAAAFILFGG